jgi:hypothetical protein
VAKNYSSMKSDVSLLRSPESASGFNHYRDHTLASNFLNIRFNNTFSYSCRMSLFVLSFRYCVRNFVCVSCLGYEYLYFIKATTISGSWRTVYVPRNVSYAKASDDWLHMQCCAVVPCVRRAQAWVYPLSFNQYDHSCSYDVFAYIITLSPIHLGIVRKEYTAFFLVILFLRDGGRGGGCGESFRSSSSVLAIHLCEFHAVSNMLKLIR